MKITSLKPSEPQETAAVIQRAYHLIYALGPEQFKELTAFAGWQLCVGCRHGGAARQLLLKEATDLLHDAFERVLAGLRDPQSGRHPQGRDVKTREAFLRYFRNVIRSVRHKQATSAARYAEVMDQMPVPEMGTVPEEDPESRDFREAFLARLHQELDDPGLYASVLEAWRADFFRLDKLGELGLNRKDAVKLRAKARRLYFRLSEPPPVPPTLEPEPF